MLARAPFCRDQYGRQCQSSLQPFLLGKVDAGKISKKPTLIVKAAQIQQQLLLLDTADDGNGKFPQRPTQPFKGLPLMPLCGRTDRNRRTRKHLKRQCTRAELAFARNDSYLKERRKQCCKMRG